MPSRVLTFALLLTAALCASRVTDTARGSSLLGTGSGDRSLHTRPGRELPVHGHDPGRVAAGFDSLYRAHPSDPVPAYWRARSLELLGELHKAHCGYLRLEDLAYGERAGLMAKARRLALERRWADLAAKDEMPDPSGPGPDAMMVLLLPPDNLGPPEDELFAIVWTYLLYDALSQAGLCVLPLPVTMAAQEVLASGGAVRVPVSVASQPVNTVEGLRGHLSLLKGFDGSPYLAGREGGWDQDLQSALLNFQRELEIPPTGEADLVTQGRLQAALETWLLRLPPPLDPRHVPSLASRVGADAVIRGTYRSEGGRYTMRIGLLDSSGAALDTEPILVSVPPGRAGEAAVEAARFLASALGMKPGEAVVNGPAPEEFDPVTASLLLMDRGMPHLARQRWNRAPEAWFDWAFLADRRRASEIRTAEIEAWEEQMRSEWLRRPELDPDAAFDRIMSGLGRPGPAGGPTSSPDPGPGAVLGNEGILRIRGEIR